MQVYDDPFQAESGWNLRFHPEQNKFGIISASDWLFKNNSITMHGKMNVKRNMALSVF